ncbi:MAG: T9SS type A sorting domain-containing protein [Bacteroidetes bacterium]|nr:T9SS type A sorting domain-containing protein [Bacteroidota bacterium]
MKKLILIILLFISKPLVYSQVWSELGKGTNALNANGSIYTMCVDTKGNIYVAGEFTNSKGRPYVAKWDGTKWSELTSDTTGISYNWTYPKVIYSICTDTKGNIYASGNFLTSTNKFYVAKWDGTKWSQLGTGTNALNANANILSIGADGSDKIYATGKFENSKFNKYVAKWDGTKWSELGAINSSLSIRYMYVEKSGKVYVDKNTSGTIQLFFWNGTKWAELGDSANKDYLRPYSINAINSDKNGNVYVGGNFKNANNQYYLAKWNGVKWSQVDSGFKTGGFATIFIDNANNIYGAGAFKNTKGKTYVAKYDGSSWSHIGGGVDTLNGNGTIGCIFVDGSSNVYATGFFTNTNGKYYVAKYGTLTSIEDISEVNEFKLYPNPATTQITINTTDNKSVLYIYDITGRLVHQQNISAQETTINTENYPKGIYTATIINNNKVAHSKFVVGR